jgi:hypothetical protein
MKKLGLRNCFEQSINGGSAVYKQIIASLCSTSKIFERLILMQILEIQVHSKVDITRQGEHGLKKKRSTPILSADLQFVISRAFENDEFVLVLSLDLSSALNVVNVDLLIKRLKIQGP